MGTFLGKQKAAGPGACRFWTGDKGLVLCEARRKGVGLKPHLSHFGYLVARLKSCPCAHFRQGRLFLQAKSGRPWRLPQVSRDVLRKCWNYLPGLAGAEAGAGFTPSSTECEPTERW